MPCGPAHVPSAASGEERANILLLACCTQEDDGGRLRAQVVAMLQRKGGATITEIMKSMGWQRHTVRGFMAGAMKKAGYAVESFKPEGGERSYRINK